jgi:hypothetical protein
MQQELFKPVSLAEQSTVDSIGVRSQADEQSRWYCIKEILYEQYLLDMRCWHKPKYQYSKDEVKVNILGWIKDHEEGKWTNNCGHCLFCIRKLLAKGWASLDEIAGFVLRNNNVKYSQEIGTWGNGFEENFEEETKETSDSLAF